MEARIRIGLVGTRFFAELLHIPSIKSHDGAVLHSICGRDKENAAKVAERYGIENAYSDYREMFSSGELNGVVIASPDDLHYEMVMCALKNNLNVMCEKPLAQTVAQAREMYNTADIAGVVNMVNFTWRGMSNIRFMLEVVAGGEIGEPVACHMLFLSGSGEIEKKVDGPLPWSRDPNRAHGKLGGLGSHIFDLARLFMGEISSVTAHVSSTTALMDVDGNHLETSNDSASVLCTFENGAHGFLSVGYAGGFSRFYLRIIGRKAMIETTLSIGGMFDPEKHVVPSVLLKKHGDDDYSSLTIPAKYPDVSSPKMFWDSFLNESFGDRQFIDAIIAGGHPKPDFHDGLKVQEIIAAAESSHRQRAWQTI